MVNGPNGMVVWNLIDLEHFFESEFSIEHYYKVKYEMLFNQDGNFKTAIFSNSGRYIACIKEEDSNSTEILIYDLYNRENYESYVTLEVKHGSKPEYLSFSPNDHYLAISCQPSTDGTNLFKVYDFHLKKLDQWRFTFELKGQKVRQVLWS